MPEVAQLGDPVVLDCDYTLEESLVEGLVVKWFFNEKPSPIYQWIPNKKPQESGEITDLYIRWLFKMHDYYSFWLFKLSARRNRVNLRKMSENCGI